MKTIIGLENKKQFVGSVISNMTKHQDMQSIYAIDLNTEEIFIFSGIEFGSLIELIDDEDVLFVNNKKEK